MPSKVSSRGRTTARTTPAPARTAARQQPIPDHSKAVRGEGDRSPFPHLWQHAAAFAARQHKHQIRKDGATPYFSHVVRVAFTVSQVFGCTDDAVLCMALLHDTIEDTTTDYDDIESRFGEDIAKGVAALTKNMALPEEEREAEYDARIAKADWRVRLVKLADTYDNLCDVVTQSPDRVKEKRKDAIKKCKRAIDLASKDVKANPHTAGAIAALATLIR